MKNNLREQNLKNLNTEKTGIQILREDVKGFMVPSKEQRKHVYELCDIDYKKYSRSIDGIIINVESFDLIESKSDFYLVEIKTTNAKNVTNLPYNVFFGFTKNEEDLFKKLDNYRLCIVHTGMRQHKLLTFNEYNSLVQTKRVQYQINFRSE
tara:strand:+ start:144 stop:599 length:456 start_codon:yes stop_codon:yes gene_type:complete